MDSRKSSVSIQGRNDGNIKVILPKCVIPVGVNSKEKKMISPGDYVAVHITDGSSQTLKGVPLYHTTLVDFE